MLLKVLLIIPTFSNEIEDFILKLFCVSYKMKYVDKLHTLYHGYCYRVYNSEKKTYMLSITCMPFFCKSTLVKVNVHFLFSRDASATHTLKFLKDADVVMLIHNDQSIVDLRRAYQLCVDNMKILTGHKVFGVFVDHKNAWNNDSTEYNVDQLGKLLCARNMRFARYDEYTINLNNQKKSRDFIFSYYQDILEKIRV